MGTNLENIPYELRSNRRWLNYILEPRTSGGKNKIPCNSYGQKCSKVNQETWLSFEQALGHVGKNNIHGVGYCPDDDIVCIDLDQCFEDDKKLKAHARDLVDSVDGWTERSLSGRGLHIFTRLDQNIGNPKNPSLGIEVLGERMFIAMTGDVFEDGGQIPAEPVSTNALLKYITRTPQRNLDAFEAHALRESDLTLDEAREIVLTKLVPRPRRDEWIRIGMALHFQFKGTDEAFDIWHEYSRREGSGTYEGYNDVRRNWDSFKVNKKNPITFASIRYLCKEPANPELAQSANDLLQPIHYDLENIQAPDYLLEGLFPEGLASIAGERGSGKTQMIVHLACLVAHLIGTHEMRSPERRKVYYFTEHEEQVIRIMYGLSKFGGGEINSDDFEKRGLLDRPMPEVREWFKLIPTQKMTAAEIAKHVKEFGAEGVVRQGSIAIPPLLIFDTASASFNIDDENSNAEWSKFIAAVKQAARESNPSVWVVTHTSKGSQDIERVTARGASAIESDVATAAVVKREIGSNVTKMLLTKNRAQTDYNALSYTTQKHEAVLTNKTGRSCSVRFDVGTFALTTLREIKQEQVRVKEVELESKRAVQSRKLAGQVYSRIQADAEQKRFHTTETLRAQLGVQKTAMTDAVNDLVAGGYIQRRPLSHEEKEINTTGATREGLFMTSKTFDPLTFRNVPENTGTLGTTAKPE